MSRNRRVEAVRAFPRNVETAYTRLWHQPNPFSRDP